MGQLRQVDFRVNGNGIDLLMAQNIGNVFKSCSSFMQARGSAMAKYVWADGRCVGGHLRPTPGNDVGDDVARNGFSFGKSLSKKDLPGPRCGSCVAEVIDYGSAQSLWQW